MWWCLKKTFYHNMIYKIKSSSGIPDPTWLAFIIMNFVDRTLEIKDSLNQRVDFNDNIGYHNHFLIRWLFLVLFSTLTCQKTNSGQEQDHWKCYPYFFSNTFVSCFIFFFINNWKSFSDWCWWSTRWTKKVDSFFQRCQCSNVLDRY